MSDQLFERTMAFAGILQAVAQVQYIARHGDSDKEALAASLNSVLVTNPESTADVYADKEALKKGYQMIALGVFSNR